MMESKGFLGIYERPRTPVTALSRLKHGFDSRRGHQLNQWFSGEKLPKIPVFGNGSVLSTL